MAGGACGPGRVGGLWAPGLYPPDVDVAVLEVRQSLPVSSSKALWAPLCGLGGFSWRAELVWLIRASCVEVNVCLERDFKPLREGPSSDLAGQTGRCEELRRDGGCQNPPADAGMLEMGDSGAEAASCVFEMCRGFPVGQVKWEKCSRLPFSAGGGRMEPWQWLPAAERVPPGCCGAVMVLVCVSSSSPAPGRALGSPSLLLQDSKNLCHLPKRNTRC